MTFEDLEEWIEIQQNSYNNLTLKGKWMLEGAIEAREILLKENLTKHSGRIEGK